MKIVLERATGTLNIGDIEVDFKQLTTSEKNRLRIKNTDYVGKQQIPRLNEGEFAKDMFVDSVTGWRGLVGEDGKQVECNKKNKESVYEFYGHVADAVINKILEFERRGAEEERKN